jgi:hypothetical protein
MQAVACLRYGEGKVSDRPGMGLIDIRNAFPSVGSKLSGAVVVSCMGHGLCCVAEDAGLLEGIPGGPGDAFSFGS